MNNKKKIFYYDDNNNIILLKQFIQLNFNFLFFLHTINTIILINYYLY